MSISPISSSGEQVQSFVHRMERRPLAHLLKEIAPPRYCIAREAATSEEEDKTLLNGIVQLNDGLYMGKKEDNLYFVLQRVDKSNESFWSRFSRKQQQLDTELRRNNSKIYQENKAIVDGFYRGLKGFNESLNFTNNKEAEIWVAYASYTPVSKRGKVKEEDIEMFVTVTTSKNIPFVTHMGIARSMSSISLEKPKHKGLSVQLHSFAAKVIKKRYPQKRYMITVPLKEMRNILLRSLPDNTIYIGDNIYKKELEEKLEIEGEEKLESQLKESNRCPHIIERELKKISEEYNDLYLSRFILRTPKGEILLDIDKKTIDKDEHEWFFRNACLKPNESLPYVAIDLSSLAAYLAFPQEEPTFFQKVKNRTTSFVKQ